TRFLAASNRDLKAEMEKGRFRADLFYRLNVVGINIPPLRERGKDIELLAQHFLQQHSRKMGKRIRGLREDLVGFLNSYAWPGNVRELENLVERAVILTDSEVLTCDDLSDTFPTTRRERPESSKVEGRLSIEDYIKEFITRNQGTHSEMELAAMLGIGRKA